MDLSAEPWTARITANNTADYVLSIYFADFEFVSITYKGKVRVYLRSVIYD
jgi:hypothetical protein